MKLPVSYLLMFNAKPTGMVISRLYTLQSLLIIKNKTWFVKRIWFLIQLKCQVKKKNYCTAVTLIKLLR